MRVSLVALAAAAALATVASSSNFKPTPQIVAAFRSDGYQVISNTSINGARGFVAQSLNTTLLSTGAHKTISYVEGSAYEMGYLQGLMHEEGAGAMTNTYVDHFLISLISVELDQK